jgi:hypothetical protein
MLKQPIPGATPIPVPGSKTVTDGSSTASQIPSEDGRDVVETIRRDASIGHQLEQMNVYVSDANISRMGELTAKAVDATEALLDGDFGVSGAGLLLREGNLRAFVPKDQNVNGVVVNTSARLMPGTDLETEVEIAVTFEGPSLADGWGPQLYEARNLVSVYLYFKDLPDGMPVEPLKLAELERWDRGGLRDRKPAAPPPPRASADIWRNPRALPGGFSSLVDRGAVKEALVQREIRRMSGDHGNMAAESSLPSDIAGTPNNMPANQSSESGRDASTTQLMRHRPAPPPPARRKANSEDEYVFGSPPPPPRALGTGQNPIIPPVRLPGRGPF